MKLYHWTRPQSLLSITFSGLQPKPPYEETPHITAGQDVVWMTANPCRDIVEQADKEQAAAQDFNRPWLFGDVDSVRLTITFNSTNRRKLYHWREWISQKAIVDKETGEQYPLSKICEFWMPSCLRDHWICLRPIPVSQIEFPPLTVALALLGLKDDAPQREQLERLPPDTLIGFDGNTMYVARREAA